MINELVRIFRGTRRFVRFGLVAVLGASSSVAALHWDSTEAKLRMNDSQSLGQARFTFTNTGPAAVDILEVLPHCGCIAVLPAKRHFEPGEKGGISVEFHNNGLRAGPLRFLIEVTTSDGAPPARLFFAIDIDTLVAFERRALYWRRGEARDPRTVRITFAPGHGGKLVSTSSNEPGFAARLLPVDGDDHAFDLVITPPASGIATAMIEVHALLGPERTARTYTVLARTVQ